MQYVAVIHAGLNVFVRSLPGPSPRLLTVRLWQTSEDFLSGLVSIHDARTRCHAWEVDFLEEVRFAFSPERRTLDGVVGRKIYERSPGDLRGNPERRWPLKRCSHSLDRATLDQYVANPS